MASSAPCLLRRFLRWSLWLGLGLALALQLRVLSHGGLRLPDFAVALLARRAADQGFSVRVGDVWLDPSGRLLLNRPRVGLSATPGELASARAVALQLRRRELLRGNLVFTRVEINGLALRLPAQHSPSGAEQALLESGEFILVHPPGDSAWQVKQASARVLAVPTSFTGLIPSAPARAADAPAPASPASVRDGLRKAAAIYRHVADLPLDSVRSLRIDLSADRLDVVAEAPALIVPSHPAIPDALVGATLHGTRLVLAVPFADPERAVLRIDAARLSAQPALGLASGPLSLRLHTPAKGMIAADLAASGILKSDAGLPAVPLVATASYTPAEARLESSLATRIAGAPWSAAVAGDPAARAGEISAAGPLTPALLELVRPFLPEKARPVLTLTDPVALSLDATFAPGGAPTRVAARASAGRAVAHHVRFDRAGATLLYEPAARRFRADDLVLFQDDSRAEGSYEMETDTLAFRFLLGGRIRPVAIRGWFRDWWPNFWANFTFGPAPPEAEVDIQGTWREPRRTTVFVGAASGAMTLRELPLDTLATRVQVNPGGSIDLLGFHATRADHVASGSFGRLVGDDPSDWVRLDFDVRSDFPLEALSQLFPREGPAIAAPFRLSAPPRVHLAGATFGPASATPGRQRYTLDLSTAAPLRYHGFPLDSLATRLERLDDDIRLERLSAGFADGLATGRAVLSGPADDRWLAFDLALADARLDLALLRWREFQATRPAPPTPGPFADKPSRAPKPFGGKLALHLAATGPLDQPLGFAGQGAALVADADLAQIRLLGGFSSLLADLGIGLATVTLTDADARFDIAQNQLRFNTLRLTGPSASVQADGTYTLPEGQLDFTAKVRPFEQRTDILSSTVGWMLSPLSSALEVELAGTLDNPDWTFSYGPTRLLRRITGPRPSPPPSPPADQPLPPST